MSDRKSQGSSVLNELTIPVTESEHSEEGIILQELFGDIDWTQVNLGELEQQWRTELANIEQDNVKALMDSANRSQQVLPALLKAIEEVGAVEGLLVDYCQRLQLMGVEIQQIEELNRGLNIQTGNQQVLLCELDQILGMVNLPDDIVVSVERMPLGVPANAQKIADAARAIHKLLSTKFEDGLGNIMAVSERMEFYSNTLRRFVDKLASFFISAFAGYRDKFLTQKGSRKVIKLTGLDELEPFLVAYAPLISGLREMDGRKHTEIAAAYQSDMSAMYRKEATDLVETMKSNRLIKKNADEKPYLFVSLGASTTDKISMAAVGERIISIGQQKVTIPTDRDLVTIQPFDVDNFPELESNEHLSADQLFHYLILSIALVMATQQDICATIFYGIQDEEIADERLLRLVDSMLMASFAPTGEILSQLVEYITKNDNSTAIEMLVVLDVRIPQLISELPVFAKTLQNIKRRLLTVAENFVADQVAIIDASKFTARKRAGVFPFVSLFPTFIKKMESVVGVAPGGAAREIMNKGYDRITAAIFRSLDALARGAERMDEKERINASVMSIRTLVIDLIVNCHREWPLFGESIECHQNCRS
jgi:hypothetical protein